MADKLHKSIGYGILAITLLILSSVELGYGSYYNNKRYTVIETTGMANVVNCTDDKLILIDFYGVGAYLCDVVIGYNNDVLNDIQSIDTKFRLTSPFFTGSPNITVYYIKENPILSSLYPLNNVEPVWKKKCIALVFFGIVKLILFILAAIKTFTLYREYQKGHFVIAQKEIETGVSI